MIEEKGKEEQRKSDMEKVSGTRFFKNPPGTPSKNNFFNKQNQQNQKKSPLNSPPPPAKKILYNSICREFNHGNCTRMNTYDPQLNSCKINNDTRLSHICNFNRPNQRFCLDATHNATFHKNEKQTPIKYYYDKS